jgi:biopolymer transport protein ExbD
VKFPRNARIFRGRLDVAPFAAVFFLLAIFLLLGSLVYTPGVSLQLPVADGLPGTDQPTLSVAIDPGGLLYYQNQLICEAELKTRLSRAAKEAGQPLTLLVHADKEVTYEQLVRLTLLARDAGISSAWLATRPRSVPAAIFSPKQ